MSNVTLTASGKTIKADITPVFMHPSKSGKVRIFAQESTKVACDGTEYTVQVLVYAK